MPQIAISDTTASNLTSAAASRGCNEAELASILIEEGLRREEDFQLTPGQEARLLESISQAERGESIDGDVVMTRFERALQEIESR